MTYAAHLLGLLIVAAVSSLATWWVRRQTRDRAGTMMCLLLGSHALIALLTCIQLLGSTMAWQVFWYRTWFLIGTALPIVWFLLAVYYTGREHWLTKPVWAVLVASPLLPLAMWLTDPLFGLATVNMTLETQPFPYLVPEFTGAWILLYGLVSLYPMVAFVLFFQMFLRPRRRSRWKPGAVLIGIVAIWVTTGLMQASFVPAPNFPYGHYGNGIFGAFVAVALFRTTFFDVTPLAHESIFESIDDAIIVVDAHRRIADFNARAARLFPALEDRIGDPLEDAYPALVAADDDGETQTIIRHLEPADDTPFAGAIRITTETDARTLRVSVSDITSGGQPRGYALIMRDVTELEEHALALEHKTDQLERFATVLSHDLRNPVSIASGYLDLARETGEHDHLEQAETALERIEETIDDLLRLAREGETITEPATVSLSDLVTAAWETSDTQSVTLENELDAEMRIRADPSRLKTVLENCFRNAADHGAETVWVDPLESAVGFAITDDGPGIAPADRERVLEYGYSSTDEGTGLGLSIVSSIVTAHGWSLTVTDSETGGARFEFSTLERAHPNDDPASTAATTSRSSVDPAEADGTDASEATESPPLEE